MSMPQHASHMKGPRTSTIGHLEYAARDIERDCMHVKLSASYALQLIWRAEKVLPNYGEDIKQQYPELDGSINFLAETQKTANAIYLALGPITALFMAIDGTEARELIDRCGAESRALRKNFWPQYWAIYDFYTQVEEHGVRVHEANICAELERTHLNDKRKKTTDVDGIEADVHASPGERPVFDEEADSEEEIDSEDEGLTTVALIDEKDC